MVLQVAQKHKTDSPIDRSLGLLLLASVMAISVEGRAVPLSLHVDHQRQFWCQKDLRPSAFFPFFLHFSDWASQTFLRQPFTKCECMKCSYGKRMREKERKGRGKESGRGEGRQREREVGEREKGRGRQLVMWCSWTLDVGVYLTKRRTPGIYPGSFPAAQRPQILISTFRHQHVHFYHGLII